MMLYVKTIITTVTNAGIPSVGSSKSIRRADPIIPTPTATSTGP